VNNKYFGIEPFGSTPTERQLDHLKIGKKAFIHFGMNTFSNSEWGSGKESPETFNPSNLNVRGWICDLKKAGFEFVILTAKHHDGFCLWPSKYTEFSIKNSPYKNGNGDIVREFTDACHEFNVKVGIYVSPYDRNSEYWGKDEYSIIYAKQMEEIVTQYGTIDEIWLDAAGSHETKYDWGLWAYTVKKHQPNAVIFGSLGACPYIEMRWGGNECGFAGKTHYASIDESSLLAENRNELNQGKIGGNRYVPTEVDVSIRPGWFYHKEQDDFVKSSRRIDEIWFRSVGNNAIMLLNFPPDRTGNFCRTDVENAIESNMRINKMLSVNLLDGADIKADSRYCEQSGICKAVFADNELFYASASDKKSSVIDITLSDNSPASNVLIIGEKVELGERITSFTLESLDAEKPKILYNGTSVGYLRAVKFEKGEYKRLRLTLNGIAAPITLRTLSLNYYEEDTSPEALSMKRKNLAEMESAKTTIADDRKSAEVMFGGIYPFDTVCFNCYWDGGEYTVSAFDGFKYYPIATGTAKDRNIQIKLDEPITSSYKVKIEYTKPLSQEPDIKIM
jgi:alpha-L-fucosidase